MPVEFNATGPARRVFGDPQGAVERRTAATSNFTVKSSVDPAALVAGTTTVEAEGFDGVLIAERSGWPDVAARVAYLAHATHSIRFFAAHRIGRQSPTTAARLLQTLDVLSGGRVTMHMITGHNDVDQRRDGDFASKADRYRRAGEFLEIFTRELTATEPFDFTGEFYQVEGASSGVGSVQAPRPQISWAGSSPEGLALAGQYADVFALPAEPLAGTAEIVKAVRAEAAKHGRTIRFWHNANHIVGRTDTEARAYAEAVADRLSEDGGKRINLDPGTRQGPESVSRLRIITAAEQSDWHDRALYTRLSRLTGVEHVPSFVGSPETIAAALLDYYDIGVSIFGLGSEAFTEEEHDLKLETLRLVRGEVARRDSARSSLTASNASA